MATEPKTQDGTIATTLVEAEQTKGTLPQFKPEDFAPQLVWLVLTFVALYLLMSRVALPRIGGVLEQRRNAIDYDLDRAKELRDEAEAALKEYEEELAAARTKAQAIAADTREKVAARAAEAEAKAEEKMSAKLAEAEERIAKTRDAAMANISAVAADTAEAIVAELLGKADPDRIKAAVDAEMKA